jgi:hypothetical protein
MSRIRHTATFAIAQPAAVLFPLFSAEGETLWVPGWAYENVMGSTDMHEDYVFLTGAHDHAGSDAIWIVKRHQPEHHRVELYRVEPGDKVGLVIVQITDQGDGESEVEVTYEYIGISEQGNEFIDSFTFEAFSGFVAEWKSLLEAYLAGPGS